MSTDLRVGVAGATGALGAEVIRVLDRATWRPEVLVALARASTATSHVEYGGERVPVDDVADEALDGLDALIVALPMPAARGVGEAAVAAGVPVIDCSGSLASDPGVPLVVPWLNPEALLRISHAAVSVPGPEALLLASALAPLARAGIAGAVDAVVLAPASVQGRAGIDELSRQVIALFNSAAPPRKIFEHGLAFDLLPAPCSPDAGGGTEREARVVEQLGRLGIAGGPVEVTWVGVPVFSGISASLTLRIPSPPDLALVQKILEGGGVVLPEAPGLRYLPRPRRVEGKAFAHVGRVRHGADGASLRLWLSMDNLRTTATAAVAAAAVLLRVGGGQG
ncbi:MAG TPA: hypothetical protein ENK18_03480 [Deltaproteobacteria bacterium]|nr:hypothetical protein [Deltaproteobacteria bacterium]